MNPEINWNRILIQKTTRVLPNPVQIDMGPHEEGGRDIAHEFDS